MQSCQLMIQLHVFKLQVIVDCGFSWVYWVHSDTFYSKIHCEIVYKYPNLLAVLLFYYVLSYGNSGCCYAIIPWVLEPIDCKSNGDVGIYFINS